MTENLDLFLEKARDAIKRQSYAEATQNYQQVLLEQPQQEEALNNLTLLYMQQGQPEKAKQLLEEVRAQHGLSYLQEKQLANVYRGLGLLEEAKTLYQKCLRNNNKDASVFNNLALVYFKERSFLKAEENFLQALKLDRAYYSAMYNLALTYKASNKLEEAIACLLGLLEADSDYAQANFLLGKILLEQKQADEAVKYFQRFVSYFPDDIETLQAVAVALLDEEWYELAKPYCQALTELEQRPFSAWYNLGFIAEKTKEPQEAIRCYKKSVEIEPNYFDALNNLGVLSLIMQDVKQAESCFERAVALQPENESVRYTLQAIRGEQSVQKSPQSYVAKLFDGYADHFDEHLLKSLSYRVPLLLKEALTEVGVAHFPQALDLGCGTGLAAEAMKSMVDEFVGVDLSKQMLAQAEKKELYKKLVLADVVEFLQYEQESFDLILAADVFVYIGNLRELFQAIASRIKTGGMFCFSLETLQGINFKLLTSGRFAHSEKYIRELAVENQLQVMFYKTAVTREQFNEGVYGAVVVLKKI